MKKYFAAVILIAGVLRLNMEAPVTHSVNKGGPDTLTIWPAGTPGITPGRSQEHDVTTSKDGLVGNRPVIRLGGVTDPQMIVYRARQTHDPEPAVVVFPGGGYYILAIDLEGTEICAWLNSIGVTAILVKYRAPDSAPHTGALADAQRAIGIVRSNAKNWHIDPSRIGVLGFSAGGHLAASVSCSYETRVYTPVDEADRVSCRPDFTVLIYPAYIAASDSVSTINPSFHVTKEVPPAFIVQTQRDPLGVINSIAYYDALTKAGVHAEMHLYEAGGHGYGMRPSDMPVTSWPARLADWMSSMKLIH